MARPRAWADLIWSAEITNGSEMTPLDILADLSPNPIDTITVTRLVAGLHVFMDMTNQEVQGIMRLDLGVGVCAASAFTAGVPNPAVSTEYPARGWLYVTTRWLSQNSGANSSQSQHQQSWDVDIGAMRKIDKGVLFVAATANLVDGSAIDLRVGGRIRALCLT